MIRLQTLGRSMVSCSELVVFCFKDSLYVLLIRQKLETEKLCTCSQLGIPSFLFCWKSAQVSPVKNVHLSTYLKGLQLHFTADPAEDKISI